MQAPALADAVQRGQVTAQARREGIDIESVHGRSRQAGAPGRPRSTPPPHTGGANGRRETREVAVNRLTKHGLICTGHPLTITNFRTPQLDLKCSVKVQ